MNLSRVQGLSTGVDALVLQYNRNEWREGGLWRGLTLAPGKEVQEGANTIRVVSFEVVAKEPQNSVDASLRRGLYVKYTGVGTQEGSVGGNEEPA
ncbi:hypothetical protein NDU88_003793 [Pleurodeles waltl]|uniref:Uncharacterized protein n=1 Tax=Pleurodeles waltl TaxID=8319 RepID=A0AAV7UG80_PLEWA|nr:hypothetical protein NDU88_003793 [Pleurodeles waltl]